MHGRGFEQILTGTALALVLGLSFAAPAAAQGTAAADQAAIEAQVPLPEPANVPPPSAADVAAGDRDDRLDRHRPARSARPSAADLQGRRGTGSGRDARAGHAGTRRRCARDARASGRRRQRRTSRIRDALREFIGSNRLARVIDKKSERTAVEAFYASRDYAPMFVGTDGATERGKQTIAHLRNADADGMDPNDYPVPVDPGRQRAGRDGGSRDAARRVRARLCAPRADGPRALFARQRRHLLRARPRLPRSTC